MLNTQNWKKNIFQVATVSPYSYFIYHITSDFSNNPSVVQWLLAICKVPHLPVKVGHNCFRDVCTCFLQYTNDLKWCAWVPSRVDDDRAAQPSLGMSCSLKYLSLAVGQRPGAANFSNNSTLDAGSISSVENFIDKDVCKLRKNENEPIL